MANSEQRVLSEAGAKRLDRQPRKRGDSRTTINIVVAPQGQNQQPPPPEGAAPPLPPQAAAAKLAASMPPPSPPSGGAPPMMGAAPPSPGTPMGPTGPNLAGPRPRMFKRGGRVAHEQSRARKVLDC